MDRIKDSSIGIIEKKCISETEKHRIKQIRRFKTKIAIIREKNKQLREENSVMTTKMEKSRQAVMSLERMIAVLVQHCNMQTEITCNIYKVSEKIKLINKDECDRLRKENAELNETLGELVRIISPGLDNTTTVKKEDD